MDLTQLNQILDRGYLYGIIFAIGVFLFFKFFLKQPRKSKK
jgi:hypothetical protein